MRKDMHRKSNIQKASVNKMIATTGGIISLILIIFVVSIFIYGNKNAVHSELGGFESGEAISSAQISGEEIEEASTQVGKSVNEVKKENNVLVVDTDANKTENEVKQIKEETTTKQTQKNTEKTSNTQKENKETKKEDPVFSMPVEGEIIKEYAKDKLVYSDTLKEWVTHAGIDIKADKTTVVKASEEGKVKSIKNDPRYGLTVVIEHNNGYSTIYSNLLTAEFVTAKENVKKGQTIGTVGNTATFEISDEPHLHFEILKDNVQIDPNMYIK